MSLNKSKGNMYPWITHTWNPLGGKCPHKCSYCSTKSFYYPVLKKKYSVEPFLCEKTMKDDLGKGNFIFVVSQNDLFANDITDKYIEEVLIHCGKFDNKYLLQTKNPERIVSFRKLLPKDTVICTTIESDIWYENIMNDSPMPYNRINFIQHLKKWFKTYITIEPILDFQLDIFVNSLRCISPVQINIGADSKGHNLPEPSKEKILELISELKKFTKVKLKDNLNRLIK